MKMNLVKAVVVVMFIGTCGAMNQEQERSREELQKEHFLLIARRYNLQKKMDVFEKKAREILESKEALEIKAQMDQTHKELETLSYEAIPKDAWYYDDFHDRVGCHEERKEFMKGIFSDYRYFSDAKKKLRSKL